jgi:hypothetical protein
MMDLLINQLQIILGLVFVAYVLYCVYDFGYQNGRKAERRSLADRAAKPHN